MQRACAAKVRALSSTGENEYLAAPDVDLAAPLVVSLLAIGQTADAARVINTALPIARANAALPAIAWLRAVESSWCYPRGDLAGAIAAGNEATQLGRIIGGDLVVSYASAEVAMCHAERGDETLCRQAIGEATARGWDCNEKMTVARARLAEVHLTGPLGAPRQHDATRPRSSTKCAPSSSRCRRSCRCSPI